MVNEAGGLGYDPGARHQLAQYAATGCLNSTYYASDDDQRRAILDLARRVEPDYLARVALYARRRGRMKDMPALLLALLSRRDPALFERVFPQVIARFIGFCVYQLDSNLRNSTMVGIVGGGGIGATLFTAYQRFDYDFVLNPAERAA